MQTLRFLAINEIQAFARWVQMIQERIDAAFNPDTNIPVPFTGRRHGSAMISFKRPGTIQELRMIEAIRTDNEIIEATGRRIIVRAKRINLPTAWEDRNRINQRSWKTQRLTQYRIKNK